MFSKKLSFSHLRKKYYELVKQYKYKDRIKISGLDSILYLNNINGDVFLHSQIPLIIYVSDGTNNAQYNTKDFIKYIGLKDRLKDEKHMLEKDGQLLIVVIKTDFFQPDENRNDGFYYDNMENSQKIGAEFCPLFSEKIAQILSHFNVDVINCMTSFQTKEAIYLIDNELNLCKINSSLELSYYCKFNLYHKTNNNYKILNVQENKDTDIICIIENNIMDDYYLNNHINIYKHNNISDTWEVIVKPIQKVALNCFYISDYNSLVVLENFGLQYYNQNNITTSSVTFGQDQKPPEISFLKNNHIIIFVRDEKVFQIYNVNENFLSLLSTYKNIWSKKDENLFLRDNKLIISSNNNYRSYNINETNSTLFIEEKTVPLPQDMSKICKDCKYIYTYFDTISGEYLIKNYDKKLDIYNYYLIGNDIQILNTKRDLDLTFFGDKDNLKICLKNQGQIKLYNQRDFWRIISSQKQYKNNIYFYGLNPIQERETLLDMTKLPPDVVEMIRKY
jgi:hypothetical protein